MFRLYRVTGPSMAPTLSNGDILLLRRRRANVGDIVVVDHPTYGIIVKRINNNGNLSGDNPDSTPASDLGPYDSATRVGVAIIVITPSKIRRLSARRSENRASS
ncbi:MAG: S24/S26 family peptidase [Litorimonas sp.]